MEICLAVYRKKVDGANGFLVKPAAGRLHQGRRKNLSLALHPLPACGKDERNGFRVETKNARRRLL